MEVLRNIKVTNLRKHTSYQEIIMGCGRLYCRTNGGWSAVLTIFIENLAKEPFNIRPSWIFLNRGQLLVHGVKISPKFIPAESQLFWMRCTSCNWQIVRPSLAWQQIYLSALSQPYLLENLQNVVYNFCFILNRRAYFCVWPRHGRNGPKRFRWGPNYWVQLLAFLKEFGGLRQFIHRLQVPHS